MLVFLHIPKTSGTSFREALVSQSNWTMLNCYKAGTFDNPQPGPTSKVNQPKIYKVDCIKKLSEMRKKHKIDVVFGHFKYRDIEPSLEDGDRIAFFVRDPVDRFVSNWFQIYRTKSKNVVPDTPLNIPFDELIQETSKFERLSCKTFCKTHSNRMSRMLKGLDESRVKFIGDFNHAQQDFEWFGRTFLGFPIQPQPLNVNEVRTEIPKAVLAKLHNLHQPDYIVYDRMIKLRSRLLQTFTESNEGDPSRTESDRNSRGNCFHT